MRIHTIKNRRNMTPESKEKALKSAWHAAIATVGVYEYRHNRSWLSKVLSVGLVLFHADAAICDAVGKPTTLQRLLAKLK